MTTLADIQAQPRSGLLHIDALLDQGPGWNFVTPARNTLRYTFSLDAPNAGDAGSIYSGARSAFGSAQQQAAEQVLARVTELTGVRFERTGDAAAADLHFSSADLLGSATTGYATTRWSYEYNGQNLITRYSADAWVYLDNAEWQAQNTNPTRGNAGYEVLLHEIGHALGLKHPFEGEVQLAAADDHTANTLMSYTERDGPHDDYSPYDLAALAFLYGGDGLGGALGLGGAGALLTGTDGRDRITVGSGNDRLLGGAGTDTAVFSQARDRYTVTARDGQLLVSGPDGSDTLLQVERLAFGDVSLAFDLDSAAGTTARYLGAVFGRDAVWNQAYAGIGLQLLDEGTTPAALMQLALDARLGSGFTHTALVDLLYTNLVGQAPSATDRAHWVGTLASGQYSPVTLAQMAAALELNAQNIDLTGLAAAGLGYS